MNLPLTLLPLNVSFPPAFLHAHKGVLHWTVALVDCDRFIRRASPADSLPLLRRIRRTVLPLSRLHSPSLLAIHFSYLHPEVP